MGEPEISGHRRFFRTFARSGGGGDRGVRIQAEAYVTAYCELEDDVFCGPSMVFTNVYNPRSAVTRKDEYRRTLVRRGEKVHCVEGWGTLDLERFERQPESYRAEVLPNECRRRVAIEANDVGEHSPERGA